MIFQKNYNQKIISNEIIIAKDLINRWQVNCFVFLVYKHS